MTPQDKTSVLQPPVVSDILISKKIRTTIVRPPLSPSQMKEMWAVYSRYYQLEYGGFLQKIKTNDCYALYESDQGLVGFTGYRFRKVKTRFGTCQTLYVGHTVMEKAFRGRSMFARTSLRMILLHYLQHPLTPLYVWCDSLTFKPYLIFANAMKKFYPTYREDTPPKVKVLLDDLGKHYYGENYLPETNVVHKSSKTVNDLSAEITPEKMKNPHLAFFAKRNPGHTQGHGLLTITPLNFRNLFFLAKKICIGRSK